MRRLLVLLLVLGLTSCGPSAENDGQPGTGATAPSTTTATHTALPCLRYGGQQTIGAIRDPELDEISGLARGRRNPSVLWAHNDSGDGARVFALSLAGERRATVTLSGAGATDYEDIAVQTGSDSRPYVYVADIGDNFRLRSSVSVYRFAEPTAQDATVEPQRTIIRYRYPGVDDTVPVDAESFFVDPAGNGWLVEKRSDERLAWVFRVDAAALRNGGETTAEPVTQIVANASGKGIGATGADLSADGTTLVVRNYLRSFVWRFEAGGSIESLLKARPEAPCSPTIGAGEAVTFIGDDLVSVEEGASRPLRRTSAQR